MVSSILELAYNLGLLVTLSVLSGFISQRGEQKVWGKISQGLLFGLASVIGMTHPLVLGRGLFFDGRSIMISLCGLFFGPLAGCIVAGLAAVYRLHLGGIGVYTGIGVIGASALLGTIFNARWTRNQEPLSAGRLWGLGLLVHISMILIMFSLPANAGLGVIRRLGLPILLTYPLVTLLVGKVLFSYQTSLRSMAELQESEAEIRSLNQTLEQRVRERTAQLEAANLEMEAFSYSVSHDLRAPLRNIDGFTQVLLEKHLEGMDDESRHCLSRIRLGTQHMRQLIEDLLKLSRATRNELAISTCDLSSLCSRVAHDLAGLDPGRQVEVIIQPGMVVQADPRLIEVVFVNLLGNAWKFTAKSEAPRIEVGERSSPGGERTLYVGDSGAGFDMALADKLFNAFHRLHTEAEFEGSGIGLAIVQRIIHRHGGRIWADALPGKGATFFFTLPDPVQP